MKINNFAAEESRIMHSLPSLIRQPPVIKKVRLSCEFLFMHFRRLLSFFLYFMRGTQVFAVFRLSEAKRDSSSDILSASLYLALGLRVSLRDWCTGYAYLISLISHT
jgi:hypothetical protein